LLRRKCRPSLVVCVVQLCSLNLCLMDHLTFHRRRGLGLEACGRVLPLSEEGQTHVQPSNPLTSTSVRDVTDVGCTPPFPTRSKERLASAEWIIVTARCKTGQPQLSRSRWEHTLLPLSHHTIICRRSSYSQVPTQQSCRQPLAGQHKTPSSPPVL
jgi:hypothetical protein